MVGTEDLPVAVADTSGITEDTPTVTGNLKANDTNGDGTPAQNTTAIQGSPTGSYGTVTLNPDGTYTYALDNTNPTVQQLAPGETLAETYTYVLTDEDGDTSTATLDGDDHRSGRPARWPRPTPTRSTKGWPASAATSRPTARPIPTEDGTPAQNTTAIQGSPTGSYGTVTLNPNGTYTYTLDNTNPTVNQLAPGETLQEVYTYRLTDEDGDTSTATLTITVVGTEDLPVAVADTSGITEDTPTVTGNLKANDTNGDGTPAQNTTAIQGSPTGSYGTVTLNADGTYTYALDNTNPTVQQLAPGETLAETYTYVLTDEDGDTSTATLTVTITGAEDLPVATANTNSINEGALQVVGNVKTDGTPDTNGDGTPAQNTTAIQGSPTGSYGTVTLNPNGTYTYALDNANPAVNTLLPGQTLQEVYTYRLTDEDGRHLDGDADDHGGGYGQRADRCRRHQHDRRGHANGDGQRQAQRHQRGWRAGGQHDRDPGLSDGQLRHGDPEPQWHLHLRAGQHQPDGATALAGRDAAGGLHLCADRWRGRD